MFSVYELIRPKTSGPFKLDQTYIEEIEKGWVRSDNWEKGQALQVNMDFLHSPLKSGEVNGVSYPANRLQTLISNTPAHLTPGGHIINYTSPQRNSSVLSPSTPKYDFHLAQMEIIILIFGFCFLFFYSVCQIFYLNWILI